MTETSLCSPELYHHTIAKRHLAFRATGLPVPQGSMRAFTRGGKTVVTSTSGERLKTWREVIYWSAYDACKTAEFGLCEGPCAVSAEFVLPRPPSRAKKYLFPDKKPDLDKLTRGLLDGMTSVVYRDDAQVVTLTVSKRYPYDGEAPGALVQVWEA